MSEKLSQMYRAKTGDDNNADTDENTETDTTGK